MSNNIFEKLKLIETARFFIATYNYREVEIKNVEGIFIENRLAHYPLIRISNQKHETQEAFLQDIEIMKKVIKEYEIISSIETVKCINIYFAGEVQEVVDSIHSLVISDNESIQTNEILINEFPLIKTNFNIDRVDQLSTGKSINSKSNSNERKITDMFSASEIAKKTRFSRYFLALFFALNMFVLFMYPYDTLTFKYDYAYYNVFAFQFDQYYRLLTGLFVEDSIIYVLVFSMFFFRFSTFVELKLGTKKLMILFAVGLIMIYASMLFVTKGYVVIGAYPLLALMVGSYIATTLLPSERDFTKLNLMSSSSTIVFFIILGFFNPINITISAIAFCAGFALVFALDIKDRLIKKNYILVLLSSIIIMIGLNYLPNQALIRNTQFEKDYISYIKYDDEKKAKEYQTKLDDYYKKFGAVDYE